MDFNACHLDKDRKVKFNYVDIRPMSDLHLGDKHCNKDLIQEDINWIADKANRYTVLTGDIMDCATLHSVSNTYESTMTPHQELKAARKLYEPINERVLASIQGNHERRIDKNDGMDVSEELARDLDCHYSKEGMVLKVKFGERKSNQKPQVYTIYLSHGFSGARTTGGKANRLEKLRKIVVTDVYVVSHTHQKISFSKSIYWPDLRNNKVTKKRQDFVNTGAYLDYGGYGQQKAYDPTELGSMTIRLYGDEKRTEIIL